MMKYFMVFYMSYNLAHNILYVILFNSYFKKKVILMLYNYLDKNYQYAITTFYKPDL